MPDPNDIFSLLSATPKDYVSLPKQTPAVATAALQSSPSRSTSGRLGALSYPAELYAPPTYFMNGAPISSSEYFNQLNYGHPVSLESVSGMSPQEAAVKNARDAQIQQGFEQFNRIIALKQLMESLRQSQAFRPAAPIQIAGINPNVLDALRKQLI